jgi:hypothetical protein
MLGNAVTQHPGPPWSVFKIYRTGNIAMLTFVAMRALPDALWMLAWGEVSDQTIRFLIKLDLVADGFALIPFGVAVLCWAWGRQAIPQILSQITVAGVGGGPLREIIFRNGRIVLVVLLIAIGVTIGKASA